MSKPKEEKWDIKDLGNYLRDKFVGILARKDWDNDDVEDVLIIVCSLLKQERQGVLEEVLTDLHSLRANIPLTYGSSAREQAKKLIEKYQFLKEEE